MDPSRAPGSPARVPATLEALRKDFAGETSLTGEKGRSLLRERFGWGERELALAEAMIQRTEFPFGDSHPNPYYKEASPLARYEAQLKALPEADRAFALREGALLSEYADKSSWYATESFPGAMKVVEGLANEINTASGGKAQMSAAKLDTAGFLSVLGEPKSFELDRAVAAKVGLEAPVLPGRAEAWRLMGGDYGARFEANIKGFAAYKEALARGEAHEAAASRGGERAASEFEALRARGADVAGRSAPDVGGARELVRGAAALPGRLLGRAWTEVFGDSGGRLYFTRTFAELVPFRGTADAVMRRAMQASLKEPGSVVGVLEANRIDTQKYSDCSVRANYNHPELAPVRDVLPYEDFLRIHEALVGSRLRDVGTYQFQKGHALYALGYELGESRTPTSGAELASMLRADGAVFGSVNFKMPRTLSPMDPTFSHAVVVNGAIRETGWNHVLSAAADRGWAKTAWGMVRAPRETLAELKNEGLWRFVVTDSNFSRPQLYSFSELRAMRLEATPLVSRSERVPGGGFAQMTPAEHMRRAALLQKRLKDVEVPPVYSGGLLERVTVGRQAKLGEAPVLMRADRKAALDIEGWLGAQKHLEVLPAAEARARFPELPKAVDIGRVSHFIVDPANPRQFATLEGHGDAVTLGRRGDGNFRWPLGVKNTAVRVTLEAEGLRVERLDGENVVLARGARLKVLEAAGAEAAGRALPEPVAEVGAAERPKVSDVWRSEREALAARLAAERRIDPAQAAKAIDAFNAELGLGPGIFAGMPDRVTDHFGRMAANPELLKRLPKAAAPGVQTAGRAAAPDLAPLAEGLRPADPAKLGNMEAAFPVVDAQGRPSYLKTAFYRGMDMDGAGTQNARIEVEAVKTAALKRDFTDPSQAPQAPAPAGVRLPEVLGFGTLDPATARALYGPRAPEVKGVQLETLPGRLLQSYMDMNTGEYRRADGSPVMTRSDFARLEGAVKRMHALGRGWGDFHDGQVLVRGEAGRLEFGLIDFGTVHQRTGPADAKFREIVADDLTRLSDLKTSLFGEKPSGGFDVGAAERGPTALERAHGRFNIFLGKGFYKATGGSFGILPETFGRNASGDPLIILERKTVPFSQLLPASLRPSHYLSIGVNAAPDLASKKSLIKAFGELTAPETLKRLGVGEPGGASGFRVVTENPALVAFAKRFEKDGWKVTPYEEGTGSLDKVQHWLQHPFASVRRLGESLLGIKRPDGRHIISRDFAPERAAVEAPLPDGGMFRALPAPANGVVPLPEAPGNLLRGVRGGAGENLLNAPNSPRAPPADVGAIDPNRLFGTSLTGRFNKAANHIREEAYITKAKQGVKGAHDAEGFKGFLEGKGRILSEKPVPGLEGVVLVEYKMFKMRPDRSVTDELQSGQTKKKTLFDPAVWSPEKLEALAEEVFGGVELLPAGQPTRVTYRNYTFVGYRDAETGGLASFGIEAWKE
ncbi:hypothetical protein EPO15_07480 [bacterium]|nr:MAG: hypothetical protein EPO15_07480 [bacterium]